MSKLGLVNLGWVRWSVHFPVQYICLLCSKDCIVSFLSPRVVRPIAPEGLGKDQTHVILITTSRFASGHLSLPQCAHPASQMLLPHLFTSPLKALVIRSTFNGVVIQLWVEGGWGDEWAAAHKASQEGAGRGPLSLMSCSDSEGSQSLPPRLYRPTHLLLHSTAMLSLICIFLRLHAYICILTTDMTNFLEVRYMHCCLWVPFNLSMQMFMHTL